MTYELSYDVAAVIIFIVVLSLFYTKKRSPYAYNNAFAALAWICLLTAVFDIISAILNEGKMDVSVWTLYLVNILYLLFQNFATPVFAIYIIMLTNVGRKMPVKYIYMVTLPITFVTLLIVSTPWTKMIFQVSDAGEYSHGPFFLILHVVVLYYFLLGANIMRRYGRTIAFEKRLALYSFLPVVGIGVILQLVFSGYLIQIFTMSVSLTLLLYSVQNVEEILDHSTGTFTYEAFCDCMLIDLYTKQRFWVLTIDISNYAFLSRSLGVDKMDILLKSVADYLKLIHPKAIVGRIKDQKISIKLPNMKKEKIEQLVNSIMDRFANAFDENQTTEPFRVKMTCILCPDEAETIEQIIDILDYVETINSQNKVFFISDLNFDKRNKNYEIRAAVRNALEKKTFEVYYQPIYSVEKKRIISAEALIRLNDEKLGFISPELFIPLAEKEGYILEIGKFVFETVCRDYKETGFKEMGIEYVEVNLSVVECMQHNLADVLFQIINQYQVSPKCINLEITETATGISRERLSNMMNRLTEDGFTFSMDDYGTGYSSMEGTYGLPFKYIKIDKSILWTSMQNEKAYIVLKWLFASVREAGMKIIMEGVESEEHIMRLLELDCDYFQGYYFSKPVPKAVFMKYLENFELPEILR